MNVTVKTAQRATDDVLFRAYIPLTGDRAALDFFGDQPVQCQTVDEMQNQIVGFLAQPEVRARLAMLGSVA
jgi:hypothetical protein